uniref:Uncharacterized protein n=1 Tax=Podoviridae sp. ctz6O13 TaxID=2827757 RepID=A0A8S5TLM5_9CAUD|nr:MAG TPA: hypothetical protein [Podoviridae sp. ctz6O13]
MMGLCTPMQMSIQKKFLNSFVHFLMDILLYLLVPQSSDFLRNPLMIFVILCWVVFGCFRVFIMKMFSMSFISFFAVAFFVFGVSVM